MANFAVFSNLREMCLIPMSIFRNVYIRLSSAANLVPEETILFEKFRDTSRACFCRL